MLAIDMTFGVEIECTLPAAVIAQKQITIGVYRHGVQVPGLPAGWVAMRDGSIQADRDHRGVEIVSPVLKGKEGLEQAQAVLRTLKAWGARVNKSTGLHIHVGAGFRENLRKLLQLVHLVAQYERALFATTGTRSREHGVYAKPVSETYKAIAGATEWRQVERAATKYQALNLVPLFGSKKTIEFRLFQGTMNATKLGAYIQLVLGLCEKAWAMRTIPQWQCEHKRFSASASNLLGWLLYNLNWCEFRKQDGPRRKGSHRFGILNADAVGAFREELKRLAKKYEAAPEPVHEALRSPVAATVAGA